MISPEALEKAQAIDWTRIDDALISCAGLLKTLCRDNIGDTAASELEYARSVIAALQAERDAAAPKLPDDLAGLVERLEEPGAVCWSDVTDARTTIQSLVARNAELEAGVGEIANPDNWVMGARFDPHSGNFAAFSFAASLLNKDRQP